MYLPHLNISSSRLLRISKCVSTLYICAITQVVCIYAALSTHYLPLAITTVYIILCQRSHKGNSEILWCRCYTKSHWRGLFDHTVPNGGCKESRQRVRCLTTIRQTHSKGGYNQHNQALDWAPGHNSDIRPHHSSFHDVTGDGWKNLPSLGWTSP